MDTNVTPDFFFFFFVRDVVIDYFVHPRTVSPSFCTSRHYRQGMRFFVFLRGYSLLLLMLIVGTSGCNVKN